LAGDLVGPRTQLHRPRRTGPAQVEVAVLQAHVIAGVDVVVDRQGQRGRFGEHVERGDDDLDVTSGQIGILVARRATLHLPRHLDAELVAQRVRLVLVTEHDLHDTRGVAEVDEGHATVVAAASYPAGEGHRGTGVPRAQGAGGMRTNHRGILAVRAHGL